MGSWRRVWGAGSSVGHTPGSDTPCARRDGMLLKASADHGRLLISPALGLEETVTFTYGSGAPLLSGYPSVGSGEEGCHLCLSALRRLFMRGSHTQAQGAAGQETPLWILGPREGSNLPRDPCVTPGVQLLPPQPLALPLWRPHPPVRGQVSSGLPVEKQRGCGTRRRVQSFTTLTSKKNRGLHCTWRAGGEGGVKARRALEMIEPHVRIPSEGSV